MREKILRGFQNGYSFSTPTFTQGAFGNPCENLMGSLKEKSVKVWALPHNCRLQEVCTLVLVYTESPAFVKITV